MKCVGDIGLCSERRNKVEMRHVCAQGQPGFELTATNGTLQCWNMLCVKGGLPVFGSEQKTLVRPRRAQSCRLRTQASRTGESLKMCQRGVI